MAAPLRLSGGRYLAVASRWSLGCSPRGVDCRGASPTISWILAELRTQPFVYAYLLVATLVMMTILGWMVGRKEDLLGRALGHRPADRPRQSTPDARRRRRRAESQPHATARRWRCCSSISIVSRTSMIVTGMATEIARCSWSRRPAPELPRHGSSPPATAATSSSCSRSTRRRPRRCVLAHRIRDSAVNARALRAGRCVEDRRADQPHRLDRRRRPGRRPRCPPSTRCTPPPIARSTRRSSAGRDG